MRQGLLWARWVATGLSVISGLLYLGLYLRISAFREDLGEQIRQLPIFARIVLNIYQPFLMVFIIITISLLILFFLKLKKPGGAYKVFLAFIIFNGLFAATLLGVTFLEVS